MNLHEAVRKGNLQAVEVAIRNGEDVNSVWNGSTPLGEAAWNGHINIVRYLISSGATVNLAFKYKRFPLILGASEGHAHIVRELLSSGADVDLADICGTTALLYAARKGHTDVLRELLLAGASINLANKKGTTPLMYAAEFGHICIVRELLSSGANVDLMDNDGWTALKRAKASPYSNEATISLLSEALSTSSTGSFVPVFPRNWTAESVREESEKKQLLQYQEKTPVQLKEMSSTIPAGYPLYRSSLHPGVTFYDKPQEKEFTSTGGHADFENGVEVTIQPDAITSGSKLEMTVQPSFAPSDVFLMPEGVQSASPTYLISRKGSANLTKEVTVTVEHHTKVSTREEAQDLLFLQANSSPKRSGSGHVYEYQEIAAGNGRSEFIAGENKGRLTARLRRLSKKFLKVGLRAQTNTRDKDKLASDHLNDSSLPNLSSDLNLYTVRVYRSPSQATSDRLVVICISLYGRLYAKFLETFDNMIIPRDYPEVSSKVADRTILGSLHFKKFCATLHIDSIQGWSVEPDRKTISKCEADQPETENYRPEDLHDYPPRITCRFFPEKNVPERTACVFSLEGLWPEVQCSVTLTAPICLDLGVVVLDTTKIKEAADHLKCTVLQSTCSHSQHVKTIISLMERMNDALRSSSLCGLSAHTDSIKTEVGTVVRISKKVAEECTRHTISGNIRVSVSKMEVLSHLLCQVSKVKVKNCHVDLGASLLEEVDSLLKDMQTLHDFGNQQEKPAHMYSLLVTFSEKIVQSLSHEPKAIALRLLSAGFITERVLQETNELNEINADKAARLYTAVLSVVGDHPHKFQEFVSILQTSWGVHKNLLEELKSATDMQ